MTLAEEIIVGFKETEIGLLPEDWKVIKFIDCLQKEKRLIPDSIPRSDYQKVGKHPIIDQSMNYIAGYTDDDNKILRHPLPVIIFGDHTRIFKYIDFPFAIGADGTKLIFPKNEFEPKFLYFYFSSLDIPSKGYNRHFKLLKEKYVLCPPLPEQQKIASVLSAVQDAKEKTENVISALKELKKSMMKHLFTYGPVSIEDAEKVPLKETEIGMIPEHWKISKIKNVITLSQYGLSIRGNPKGKYTILRMNNIQNGHLDLSDLQYVDVDKALYEKFKLNKGDILFNRTNSFELVGKVTIFDIVDPFVFASYLVRIRTDSSQLFPNFLNYCLNWQPTQNRLKMLASRGVSQSNISATKLKDFLILLPSLPEQHKIAEILSAIDRKIEAEESQKNSLEALLKTLLSLLMTGKIRVKNLEIPV
jgi:type I restriction enzyme S subunit